MRRDGRSRFCQSPGSGAGTSAHRVSEGVTKNDNGARPTPPPDAVLVVLGEGGLSGFQRIPEIQSCLASTPIVVVAKRLDAADVAEALAAGACGYLVQPVPPHELLNAIREAALGWPALCREAEVAMLCLIRCAGEGASGALTRQEHQIRTLTWPSAHSLTLAVQLHCTKGVLGRRAASARSASVRSGSSSF